MHHSESRHREHRVPILPTLDCERPKFLELGRLRGFVSFPNAFAVLGAEYVSKIPTYGIARLLSSSVRCLIQSDIHGKEGGLAYLGTCEQQPNAITQGSTASSPCGWF
jgi:hypothetical protein